MATAFLAFGGNIGSVRHSIIAAWELLGAHPIIQVAAKSKLYLTAPVGGPLGQDNYINAAARIETELSARQLLSECLRVEAELGRQRSIRWAPRIIDIDLILYGSQVIDESGLTVPHPRLRERLFVLIPLLDIASAELALPPDGMKLWDATDAALKVCGETLQMWEDRVIP